jgi:hypothetical protein
LSPAALIVIDQLSPWSQRVEAGEQVVVVGARAAVEHHSRCAATEPALEDADAAYLASLSLRHCRKN